MESDGSGKKLKLIYDSKRWQTHVNWPLSSSNKKSYPDDEIYI